MIVERMDLVIAFRQDSMVVLKQGDRLQRLAGRLKGHISTVNVPEQGPAELPRLVVQLPNGLLQVALNRYQFSVAPPAHIASSYDESVAFADSLASTVLTELADGVKNSFEWSGLVTVLNFPRDLHRFSSGLRAASPAFESMMRLDWDPEELASFEVKVGRLAGAYFRNYSVRGYDIKEIQMKAPKPAAKLFEKASVDGARTSEVGLEITVDVNSRPAAKTGSAMTDLQSVFAEHRNAVTSLAKDLNLETVL